MTKRHRLPALAIAGVLAVVTAAVATAGSSDAFRSASRTTVAPAPKPRVQKPHASAMAQVRALQKQVAKAKASVVSLKKQYASAKTPAKKNALKKSIAKAQAKVEEPREGPGECEVPSLRPGLPARRQLLRRDWIAPTTDVPSASSER